MNGRLRKLRVRLTTATRAQYEAASSSEPSIWESDWESEATSDRGSLTTDFTNIDSQSEDAAHEVGRVGDWLQGGVDIAREPRFQLLEFQDPEHNVEIFESRLNNLVPSFAILENAAESSGDITNTLDVSFGDQQPNSAGVNDLSANFGHHLDRIIPALPVRRSTSPLLQPIREAVSEISEMVFDGSDALNHPRNISEFGSVLQVPSRDEVARRRLALQYNLRSLHAE